MSNGTKMTPLGKTVIFLFLAACFYGAYHFFFQGTSTAPGTLEATGGGATGTQVEIGIAYGTEKRQWLEWAADEFAKTRDGKSIKVKLLPMGSLEGANAIAGGDQRVHVWSPASSLYKEIFIQNWQIAYGMQDQPIAKEEILALTPMVLVMWKERYEAFQQKYPELTFRTIADALAEKNGWEGIANKPEWGLFKFGHTDPTESNSGLLTLLLMAYDHAKKCRDLQVADTINLEFQNWLQRLEQAVSGLSNSTGNLMREMILKGPSAYDALFVYENVAIDYLKSAQGRWGTLQVVYPVQNMWNDNPYYILNTPWSDKAHQNAAETFLAFLLSEPVQKRSLVHGFRPGDPQIPVKTPDSPFNQYAQYGLKVDIPQTCASPSPEVINNLLSSWQRARTH